MKDGLLLFLFILILVLIGYSYLKTDENYNLKARIAAYEAHRDTIFVEGKEDTIYVKKTSYIAIKTKINIDTTLDYDNHIVKVKSDTLTKELKIDIECNKPDIIIKQTDTLKIPVMKTIQIEVEKPFYETKEFGFIIGLAVAYLFFQL